MEPSTPRGGTVVVATSHTSSEALSNTSCSVTEGSDCSAAAEEEEDSEDEWEDASKCDNIRCKFHDAPVAESHHRSFVSTGSEDNEETSDEDPSDTGPRIRRSSRARRPALKARQALEGCFTPEVAAALGLGMDTAGG